MKPPKTPETDLLNGFVEIAEHLGITVRQAKHRTHIGAIPILRMGRSICARRSTLAKHFAQLEKEAAHGERR